MLRSSLLLILAILLTAVPAGAASPEPELSPPVPGRFLVLHPEPFSPALREAGFRPQGSALPGGWRTVTGPHHLPPEMTARHLSQLLGVRAEPVRLWSLYADPTSEPLFDEQWALENTGQTLGIGSSGTPGSDIDGPGAWSYTIGTENVVVAVIDSGIEMSDPELAARLWTNPGEIAGNGQDDDQNGLIDDVHGWDFHDGDADPEDDNGHGTWVASVVVAAVDDTGVTGVAPGVSLMVVRACDHAGCPTDEVAAAIEYAADMGADVINLSLGGQGQVDAVEDAIEHARSRNVLVVAAAGNEGEDVDESPIIFYPVETELDNVLGVAATDLDDALPIDEEGDLVTNYGSISVEVGAPGVDILVTDLGTGWAYAAGTSFAAPHVAGIAALMRSIDPDITPADIVAVLRDNADPHPSLTDTTAGGGRVNALAGVFGARFRDIASSTFAADIWWLADEGITRGCNPPANDHFCPRDSVTRGQMAAFLVRTLGLPATDQDFFIDDNGTTFEDDINRMAEAGITRGCNPPDNDEFCPDASVTRAQMAAFLHRAYENILTPGETTDFEDDDGSIFEDDIEWLAAVGVTKGCNPPDNTLFCPDDPVTRGQMAAFIRRAET